VEAIVRAVNDTRDNDTVAAIVGAAVGALHGAATRPYRWRDGQLGRLGTRNDGAMDQLLELAGARYWETPSIQFRPGSDAPCAKGSISLDPGSKRGGPTVFIRNLEMTDFTGLRVQPAGRKA
jgi:hypothetical protein